MDQLAKYIGYNYHPYEWYDHARMFGEVYRHYIGFHLVIHNNNGLEVIWHNLFPIEIYGIKR